MKILIVDDNKDNLHLLEAMLKGGGYQAVSAENGSEALEKLRIEDFDMIITDILMPVMDGFQLCREVKNSDELNHIIFIFYTATYTDEKDEEFALKLGADKFIRKPIEPMEFIRIIQGVIKEAQEGKLKPRRPVFNEVNDVLMFYNERLVHKLEKKIRELNDEISKHKETEDRLRESERTYRLITENANDLISVMNCNLEIEYINFETHKRVLGEIPSGGKIKISQLNIEDLEYITPLIQFCFETCEPIVETFRFKHQDGHYIWLEASARKFTDKNGEEKIIIISRDITKRKQAEEALIKTKESLARQVEERTHDLLVEKQRIETIIDIIPHGILVLDSTGTLTLANNAFKDLIRKILKKELDSPFNIHNKPNNYLFNEIKKLLASDDKKPKTIEPIKGLFLQISSVDLRIPDGQKFGNIIEIHDITQFVEFDNMRKQFVSTVSHELRTPLSVIVQSLHNIEKYKNQMSSDLQQKLMKTMTMNADLLGQIIDDLLIISRIDEKRVKLEWQEYHLLDVLNQVLELLEPKKNEKEIQITVDVDKDIILFGDPKKIGQIFRNIIDNAIKYSSNGSKIFIKAIDYYSGNYNPTNKEGTLIQVTDTGRGIQKQEIPYLFERFFRSDGVRDISGTGLGINIARDLIHLHQGEIFVDSEYGKGSTFSIFLPRLKQKPAN